MVVPFLLRQNLHGQSHISLEYSSDVKILYPRSSIHYSSVFRLSVGSAMVMASHAWHRLLIVSTEKNTILVNCRCLTCLRSWHDKRSIPHQLSLSSRSQLRFYIHNNKRCKLRSQLLHSFQRLFRRLKRSPSPRYRIRTKYITHGRHSGSER